MYNFLKANVLFSEKTGVFCRILLGTMAALLDTIQECGEFSSRELADSICSLGTSRTTPPQDYLQAWQRAALAILDTFSTV